MPGCPFIYRRAFARLTALLLLLPLFSFGCNRGNHVGGTPSTDDVAEIWEDAGLTLTEAKPVDARRYGAGYCSTGRVSGVEVLICEFSTDGQLENAKRQLQAEWNSNALETAVAMQAKRTLVALVDRANADRDGRTMSKLLAAVRKL